MNPPPLSRAQALPTRCRARPPWGLWLWAWGAFSCAGTACPFETVPPPPGEFSMGAYAVSASLAEANCQLEEVTGAAFSFPVVLSANPDAGEYFLTLENEYSRPATWDGQVVRSTAAARRYFARCTECVTRVEEDVDLALLSLSQAEAVGNACPAHPLDGGVPAPDDAGVRPPGPRESGFDALLACGELRTRVVVVEGLPDGGACPAECGACTMTYTLAGERR